MRFRSALSFGPARVRGRLTSIPWGKVTEENYDIATATEVRKPLGPLPFDAAAAARPPLRATAGPRTLCCGSMQAASHLALAAARLQSPELPGCMRAVGRSAQRRGTALCVP